MNLYSGAHLNVARLVHVTSRLMYIPILCKVLKPGSTAGYRARMGRSHIRLRTSGDHLGLGSDVHAALMCIPTCVVKLVHGSATKNSWCRFISIYFLYKFIKYNLFTVIFLILRLYSFFWIQIRKKWKKMDGPSHIRCRPRYTKFLKIVTWHILVCHNFIWSIYLIHTRNWMQ